MPGLSRDPDRRVQFEWWAGYPYPAGDYPYREEEVAKEPEPPQEGLVMAKATLVVSTKKRWLGAPGRGWRRFKRAWSESAESAMYRTVAILGWWIRWSKRSDDE